MRFKTFFSLSVAVVMGLAPIFSTQALAQISNPLDRPQSGVIAATTAPVNINYLPENGQIRVLSQRKSRQGVHGAIASGHCAGHGRVGRLEQVVEALRCAEELRFVARARRPTRVCEMF